MPLGMMAQLSKKDSLWLPMKFFIGNWKGQGEGQPGKGEYTRSYQFVLGNNFIEVKNRSVYPPTTRFPNGEAHEDIGYISYDRGIRKFRLRQFHVESFVNEYTLDSISPDGRTIVFLSENIDNIPKGFRAKETYRLVSDNELEEIFEIAEPNKEFLLYTRVRFSRK
jgi:hypothetical protein